MKTKSLVSLVIYFAVTLLGLGAATVVPKELASPLREYREAINDLEKKEQELKKVIAKESGLLQIKKGRKAFLEALESCLDKSMTVQTVIQKMAIFSVDLAKQGKTTEAKKMAAVLKGIQEELKKFDEEKYQNLLNASRAALLSADIRERGGK